MRMIEETTSLSEKDRELLGEVKGVVQHLLPSAALLLYGSVSRGEHRPDSDYDFLILTDESLAQEQEAEVEDALYDVQLRNEVLIIASFRTKDAWRADSSMPFRREVERDAIRL